MKYMQSTPSSTHARDAIAALCTNLQTLVGQDADGSLVLRMLDRSLYGIREQGITKKERREIWKSAVEAADALSRMRRGLRFSAAKIERHFLKTAKKTVADESDPYAYAAVAEVYAANQNGSRALASIQRHVLKPIGREQNTHFQTIEALLVYPLVAKAFEKSADKSAALLAIIEQALRPVSELPESSDRTIALHHIRTSIAKLLEDAPDPQIALQAILDHGITPALTAENSREKNTAIFKMAASLVMLYQQRADRSLVLNVLNQQILPYVSALPDASNRAIYIGELTEMVADLYAAAPDQAPAFQFIDQKLLPPLKEMSEKTLSDMGLSIAYPAIAKLYAAGPNRSAALEKIRTEVMQPSESIRDTMWRRTAVSSIAKISVEWMTDQRPKVLRFLREEALPFCLRIQEDSDRASGLVEVGEEIVKLYQNEKDRMDAVRVLVSDFLESALQIREGNSRFRATNEISEQLGRLLEQQPEKQEALSEIFKIALFVRQTGQGNRSALETVLPLASTYNPADPGHPIAFLQSIQLVILGPLALIQDANVKSKQAAETLRCLTVLLRSLPDVHGITFASPETMERLGNLPPRQQMSVLALQAEIGSAAQLDALSGAPALQRQYQILRFVTAMDRREDTPAPWTTEEARDPQFQLLLNGLYEAAPLRLKGQLLRSLGRMQLSTMPSWALMAWEHFPDQVLPATMDFLNGLPQEERRQAFAGMTQVVADQLTRRLLDNWQSVVQMLGVICVPETSLNAVRSVWIYYLTVALRCMALMSGPVAQRQDIENLGVQFRALLQSILNDPHSANLLTDLRRLIKVLPLVNSHIFAMRDRAVDFATAENPAGQDQTDESYAGLLREEIHNHPSPNLLRVAVAYREYLSTADGSVLARLWRPIDPSDRASVQTLRQDPDRMKRVYEALDNLIASMEVVYGRSSLNSFIDLLEETANHLSLFPFLSEPLDDLKSYIRANSEILTSETADPEAIDAALKRLSDIAQLIRERIFNDYTPSSVRLGLALVDTQIDDIVFALQSRLQARIPEWSIHQLAKFLMIALPLARSQVPVDFQPELDLVAKELETLDPAENPLRYYSVIDRVQRILGRAKADALDKYQPVAEAYAGTLGIKKEEASDFTARWLRGEPLYQLSGWCDVLHDRLAEQLGMRWRVIRPGEATARLVYVATPAALQAAMGQAARRREPAIFVVDAVPGNVTFNPYVRAIVSLQRIDTFSHVAVRADHSRVVLVCVTQGPYNELLAAVPDQPRIRLIAQGRQVAWEVTTAVSDDVVEEPDRGETGHAKAVAAERTQRRVFLRAEEYTVSRVGKKAMGLVEKEKQAAQANVKVPFHLTVPFEYFDALLDRNGELGQQIRRLRARLSTLTEAGAIEKTLLELRTAIGKLALPPEDWAVLHQAVTQTLGSWPIMVRSSTNVEDLPGYPGAGLYDSFEQVPLKDIPTTLLKVYQSLYSNNAYADRRKVGLIEDAVYPAVILQQMVPSSYSAVIHTMDPLDPKSDRGRMEIVVGLGEALVSGEAQYRGSAHEFAYDGNGNLTRIGYANKSMGIRIKPGGGTENFLVDYTKDVLSTGATPEWLHRLVRLALQLHKPDAPQDIETAVYLSPDERDAQVYLLQSRDQVVHQKPEPGGSAPGVIPPENNQIRAANAGEALTAAGVTAGFMSTSLFGIIHYTGQIGFWPALMAGVIAGLGGLALTAGYVWTAMDYLRVLRAANRGVSLMALLRMDIASAIKGAPGSVWRHGAFGSLHPLTQQATDRHEDLHTRGYGEFIAWVVHGLVMTRLGIRMLYQRRDLRSWTATSA